jgi:hypothetical protein
MEKIKTFAEVTDILIKLALALAAFWFVELAKTQSEAAKMQAEQTKLLAEAQSVGRQSDTELTKVIIDLLFKQNMACPTEDQMVIVSFLSDMNDQYNRVKLGGRLVGALSSRKCTNTNPALAADSELVRKSQGGVLPTLAPGNVAQVISSLEKDKAFEQAQKQVSGGATRDYDGFVALGRPLNPSSTNFTNFTLLSAAYYSDGAK